MQPLPDYTRRMPLAGGRWGYYFTPPTWALKPCENDDRGPCPVSNEALGNDYEKAVSRVESVLLPLFDSWRTRGLADLGPRGPQRGTLDWLFGVYRQDDKFGRLGRKVRILHEAGFGLVGDYILKDGRRLGDVRVGSITAAIVDKLYKKLLPKPGADGKPLPLFAQDQSQCSLPDRSGEPLYVERRTTVNHAMKSCRRAWNVAHRLYPNEIPAANPFAGMGLVSITKPVEAATYADLLAAVAQADAMGLPSLGTALMVTWEWLQREEHIFTKFTLSHYRPKNRPDEVLVVHPKNGEAVWMPLFDRSGGALFPELMARMDAARRDRIGNALFFVRDWVDSRTGAPQPWMTPSGQIDMVGRKLRPVLDAAGVDRTITFTSFRHGGLTELGDADLTDAQIRAVSRHKSAKMLTGYVKRTQKQIIDATHKRRANRPAKSAAENQFDLFASIKDGTK